MSKYFYIIKAFVFAKFLNQRIPFYVSWELTKKCNYKCKFCYSWQIKNETEMSLRQIKKGIDTLKKINIKLIHLTGGEPLLHPDIDKIIQYINDKKMLVSMSSNGAFVPSHITTLKTLKNLSISIDGPEIIHNSIRGVGAYQKALAALKITTNYKIPTRITYVISKINQHQQSIIHVVELAKKYNIKVQFCFAYNNLAKSKIKNKYSLSKKEKDNVIELLIKYKKDVAKREISNSLAGINYYGSTNKRTSIKCLVEKLMFRIDSMGYIFRCGSMPFKKKIHILDKNFKKLLEKEKLLNHCEYCACPTRLESNFMYNLKPSALKNFFS